MDVLGQGAQACRPAGVGGADRAEPRVRTSTPARSSKAKNSSGALAEVVVVVVTARRRVTRGASGRRQSGTVTVYVYGWYGQGNVYADDFSVS